MQLQKIQLQNTNYKNKYKSNESNQSQSNFFKIYTVKKQRSLSSSKGQLCFSFLQKKEYNLILNVSRFGVVIFFRYFFSSLLTSAAYIRYQHTIHISLTVRHTQYDILPISIFFKRTPRLRSLRPMDVLLFSLLSFISVHL